MNELSLSTNTIPGPGLVFLTWSFFVQLIRKNKNVYSDDDKLLSN